MEHIFMNKILKNLKEVIFHNKILKHTQVSTRSTALQWKLEKITMKLACKPRCMCYIIYHSFFDL